MLTTDEKVALLDELGRQQRRLEDAELFPAVQRQYEDAHRAWMIVFDMTYGDDIREFGKC